LTPRDYLGRWGVKFFVFKVEFGRCFHDFKISKCLILLLYLLYHIVALSRLALKIVVMTREQVTGYRLQVTDYRFWATLLFVTYFGFFPFTYLVRSRVSAKAVRVKLLLKKSFR